MTKPTPGPWVAEESGGRGAWIKGSNGEWAALACGDTDATANANARLIAATPNLLDALQALIDWADDVGWDNTGEPSEFEAARAVVREATDYSYNPHRLSPFGNK